MPWGNEDDVQAVVRRLLKPIRAKHKAKVQRLEKKIETLQRQLADERDKANRAAQEPLDKKGVFE